MTSMKTKSDFCIPNREQCSLLEKCLYIPPSDFASASLDMPLNWNETSIFTKTQPLFVEYCSGNGQWISEMARQLPHLNWIAVERDFDRARKIWLKIFRLQLENLFVVYGEGLSFSKNFLPNASVSGAYVNFPDPWPKRRHAKHRIVKRDFVDEMARILDEEAFITLVTDDAPYSEQILSLFDDWESAFDNERYVTQWPEFGNSFFQSLWMKQQRTIRYHRFRKTNRGRGI